jgi:dynein heavy chain, axonemal
MSEQMERLSDSLYMEVLPPKWSAAGFPTTRGLASWLTNLKERCEQLENWIADPLSVPKVI